MPRLHPILLLAVGHLVVDLYQGAIPALLVHWKQAFALDYRATGAIMLAMQLCSSVVQPVFGALGDRREQRYLLPLALATAGAGMAAAVLAGSYRLALIGVVVGGLGVALYHPEASRRTHDASGSQRATAMSWFSVGGNLGLGLGPLAVAALLAGGPLALAVGMVAIGAAVALLLVAGRGAILSPLFASPSGGYPSGRQHGLGPATAAGGVPRHEAGAGRSDRWHALALLGMFVVMRSWVHAGVQAFVPMLVTEQGATLEYAQGLLAVFLLAGAAGTLVGGPLADRFGRKPVLTGSMALTVPLLWLAGEARGAWMVLVLAAAGFAVVSSFSVSVVLAQELVPRRVGTASGIMLGLSVGTGGIGVTLLGWLADQRGLGPVFGALALIPAAGLAFAASLPGASRGAPRVAAGAPPGGDAGVAG